MTWLFGDRGIPASYRHMDGFGSHTFQWSNEAGEAFWVKYHFKTGQGIKNLTAEAAARLAGEDPDSHQRDLRRAIERGEYPTWTVGVQIMPVAEAATYRFPPFDLTKVWPHADYPVVEISRDGYLYDGRHAGAKSYEPNSFDGPFQTDRPLWSATAVSGATGNHPAPVYAEDDDFVQAGNLYRLMGEDEKERLIANLAGFIAKVSRDDIVERAIDNFRRADGDYGKRLEVAVRALRG